MGRARWGASLSESTSLDVLHHLRLCDNRDVYLCGLPRLAAVE
jgi:hypothetical protein